MPYGLKYQTQFTSQSDVNIPEKLYTLQFLFKDYTGGATSLTGADTTVIQRCTVDDPVAPIKGQSLDISLINRGNTPITVFQSDDDDGVQVILLDENNNVKFIGFLVQDDFYEPLIDYTHPITLSANDNLGLLKGVILSDASVRRAFVNMSYRTNGVDTVIYMYTTNPAFYPQAGNPLEIGGTTYTVVTAVQENTTIGLATYNWTVTVTPTTGGIAQTVATVYLTGEINLLNRNSLLSIIAICLAQTNLPLITNIFHNLYEYRQDNTITTFDQTLIDTQLFISGETYQDCYTVLTKIMEAFNCTLFQANGQWNIISWHEARLYTNNAIPGFVYDETWAVLGNTVFTNNFFIGPEVLGPPRVTPLTRPIAGLTQGALRGYKFTRKVFDYHQPKYLLRNYDLQQLGDLISTYNDGTYTYNEYVAIGWTTGFGTPLCERFIRVQLDSANNEIQRFLVLRNTPFDSTRAVSGVPFEITQGDKIKFSFSFRTNVSQPGPATLPFAVQLFDGTTTRYVDDTPVDNGDWVPTISYAYNIAGGDNSDQWHTVEISASQAPFSGLITVFLAVVTENPQNSGKETYYKDMRLEYTPFITDSSKITGQIHKQERVTGPKLNQDENITIDDSPRNSIAGTLFLTSKTGLLQDRTALWRYPFDANGWRLGEHTTLDTLRWRQQTRSKLEGGFIGNYQNAVISLLAMAITDFNTNKNYTFGLLTIDYKRNQFSGTLWELYETGQAELVNTYTFTYIYATS